MTKYNDTTFAGERSLYGIDGAEIDNCIFEDGESPLKEARNYKLTNCEFRWKYPIWYGADVYADGCTFLKDTRAGMWYIDNITVKNSRIDAPKDFRRCNNVTLENVEFTGGEETLWDNKGVVLKNVKSKGDYFAMNSCDMEVDGLTLEGNYSFDGCKNVTVRNSTILSRDTFWNSENITVYDSFISGAYIGWNSKNLTLVNCTVASLQGFCYIENLVLKNCKLEGTSLAFEYVTCDVEINGSIDSIFNPTAGKIKADSIGELIVEKDDPRVKGCEIICGDIKKISDKPEWKE